MNLTEIFKQSTGLQSLRKTILKVREGIPARRRAYAWSHIYKQRMVRLVGFDSTNPALESCHVYEKSYHYLYDLLNMARYSSRLSS